MQLEFDWMRRERCALRNLESLSDVGVSEVQNGVIYLLQMHPACRLLDPERKVTALKISQAESARWLKANCPLVKHLELHRSTFRRAVLDWTARRVARFVSGQIVLSFSALLDWHAERELADAELLAAWDSVTERDRAWPTVTGRDPSLSDRGNEFLKEKQNQENPSIHQSPGIFQNLPVEVWDRELLSETHLYEALKAWWYEDGEQSGQDMDHVTGAILAARGGKTNPIRYAEKCLANGVSQDWIVKAQNFRTRMKRASVYTGR